MDAFWNAAAVPPVTADWSAIGKPSFSGPPAAT